MLLDFVKGRKGDELAPAGKRDSAWADLAKRWKALRKVKGFRTDRGVKAMYTRHNTLRKKAGRVDSCPHLGGTGLWSAEEEKVLLDFVKERKGDETAACKAPLFKDLEKAWKKSKGFDTSRTALAMYHHHREMRNKRAEQLARTPQQSSTSSTTSATAPTPSLSGSGRKRSASKAVLATSPSSASAKKPKPSSFPSATLIAMKSERDEALEELEETRDDLEECRETSKLLQLALDEKMTAIDSLKAQIRELQGRG